jgi:hypothetical protein
MGVIMNNKIEPGCLAVIIRSRAEEAGLVKNTGNIGTIVRVIRFIGVPEGFGPLHRDWWKVDKEIAIYNIAKHTLTGHKIITNRRRLPYCRESALQRIPEDDVDFENTIKNKLKVPEEV